MERYRLLGIEHGGRESASARVVSREPNKWGDFPLHTFNSGDEVVLAADAQATVEALQAQVSSYKLVNDMYLKTVDKLSRQVEALQAIIKQMGEQACVLAKDGMAAKAQVEALRRERDHAKNMAAVQKEVADNQTWHVRELTAALDAEREKVKDSETAYKKLAEQWSSARASWGKIKK